MEMQPSTHSYNGVGKERELPKIYFSRNMTNLHIKNKMYRKDSMITNIATSRFTNLIQISEITAQKMDKTDLSTNYNDGRYPYV